MEIIIFNRSIFEFNYFKLIKSFINISNFAVFRKKSTSFTIRNIILFNFLFKNFAFLIYLIHTMFSSILKISIFFDQLFLFKSD